MRTLCLTLWMGGYAVMIVAFALSEAMNEGPAAELWVGRLRSISGIAAVVAMIGMGGATMH